MRDVRGTGKSGDVLNVAAGFAAHALIPRGDAVHANAEILHKVLQQSDRKKEVQKKHEETERTLVHRLQAMSVVISAKANERGVLYGSVSRDMIAKAIREKGIPIEERTIVTEEAITACGEYQCTVETVN